MTTRLRSAMKHPIRAPAEPLAPAELSPAARARLAARRAAALERLGATFRKRGGPARTGVWGIRHKMPDATPAEIARALGVSRQNVGKLLAMLGLPGRVGVDRRGGWNTKTLHPAERAARILEEKRASRKRRKS